MFLVAFFPFVGQQLGKPTHQQEVMDSVIAAEIARLESMTVTKLTGKFEALIGGKRPPVGPLTSLTGPVVKTTLNGSFLLQ